MTAAARHEANLFVGVTDVDGRTVLEVVGDLDADTSDAFRDIVDQHTAKPRHLVFDLRGTTFIGSLGIGVIVRAHRAVSEHGHDVKVLVDRPLHRKLFEITGLDDIVRVEGGK
jgi:anti-sigma B factor antagonist